MTKETLLEALAIDCPKIFLALKDFIKKCYKDFKKNGIVLGLSGGIDSSLVAYLCKEAVGKENVLALIMPEKESDFNNFQDACFWAEELGIKYKIIFLTKYLKNFNIYDLFFLNKLIIPESWKPMVVKNLARLYVQIIGEPVFNINFKGDKLLRKINTYYRFKHRLRMIIIYLFADLENRLVVGCTNKTEYLIGFFVNYGCDDASDIMPLLSLYKTQVKTLANYLGLPNKLIAKKPSPDIIPGIFDEEIIGIDYEILDLILLGIEKGLSISQISGLLNIEEQKVKYVFDLFMKSKPFRLKPISYGNCN
uniref:NH(3)-dependent NAD(+) synthetase n=1 Tax=candidate division WOR-3 bacterium TaxID=2052148 RepID=A0A7V5XZM1_UNCW3